MRTGFTLMMVAPLAACVAAQSATEQPVQAANVGAMMQPAAGGGIQVRRTKAPAYSMSDGAQARRDADALCGRVTSTIYDRYEAGAWVFVGGCAG